MKNRILSIIFTHERPVEVGITIKSMLHLLKMHEKAYQIKEYDNKDYLVLDSSVEENIDLKKYLNLNKIKYVHLKGYTLRKKIAYLNKVNLDNYDFIDFCPDQDLLIRQIDYENIAANHHLGFSLGWKVINSTKTKDEDSAAWILLKNNTLYLNSIESIQRNPEYLRYQIEAFIKHSPGELFWGLRSKASARIFIDMIANLGNILPNEWGKVIENCCNVYYAYCTYTFTTSSLFIRDYDQSKALKNTQSNFLYFKREGFLSCLHKVNKNKQLKMQVLEILRAAIQQQIENNGLAEKFIPSYEQLYNQLILNARGYRDSIAKDFNSDAYCIPMKNNHQVFESTNNVKRYQEDIFNIDDMKQFNSLPLLVKKPIRSHIFKILRRDSPFGSNRIANHINNVPDEYWGKHLEV